MCSCVSCALCASCDLANWYLNQLYCPDPHPSSWLFCSPSWEATLALRPVRLSAFSLSRAYDLLKTTVIQTWIVNVIGNERCLNRFCAHFRKKWPDRLSRFSTISECDGRNWDTMHTLHFMYESVNGRIGEYGTRMDGWMNASVAYPGFQHGGVKAP